MFGNSKNVPCRRKGVPEIWKSQSATSLDASFEAVSIQSAAPPGMGIMKARNAVGKLRAFITSRPKQKNPPDTIRLRNETAYRLSASLALSFDSASKGALIEPAPTHAATPI